MTITTNTNNQAKGQPKTTPEVAQMLGLKIETNETGFPTVSTQRAPEGLPVVEAEVMQTENSAPAPETLPHIIEVAPEVEPQEEIYDQAKHGSIVKTVLPYIAIFVVGIFLYYFYFSTFSFKSVTNLFEKAATTNLVDVKTEKASALDQLKAANLPGYYEYMGQFYFDTSDASILDPDADNSRNGLTNFQKYILNLNPKVYDTLGSGQADSQTLAAGIDPTTGEELKGKRKDLVDNYVDLEVANNKLTQESLQNPGQRGTSNSPTGGPANSFAQVAGTNIIGARNAGASTAGIISSSIPPVQTPTNSGAVQGVNFLPPVTGAQTASPQPRPSELSGEGTLAINQNVNATLNIPSLKITVPIVWTQDTKNFEKDLKNGVVHYPGTAMPGEIGTSYISGHSSNYAWVKGNYNRVFDTLDRLKVGDSFNITVTLKNGSKVKLHYKVIKQQQYQPNDQAQLENGSKSVVALSTCWPLGTTARRLVNFGELTQIVR